MQPIIASVITVAAGHTSYLWQVHISAYTARSV